MLHVCLPLKSRHCTLTPPMSGYDPKQSLALHDEVEHLSLTTLREKLVKIGAKVVRHGVSNEIDRCLDAVTSESPVRA